MGEIAPNSSSTSCQTCVSPETTSAQGLSECDACFISFFWDSLSSECKECPEGVDCATSPTSRFLGSLDVNQGWHRFSNTSSKVYDCSFYHLYHAHCEGGTQPGDASCKGNSEGPLCGLCADGYFHPGGDEPCEKCEDASIARTLIPILIVLFVGIAGFVAWHVKFFSRVRTRIEGAAEKYSVNLDWLAIGGRIVFFDYQIITKFTEMQDVVWPAPFSGYVNLLNLIFLDFKVWLPSIECTAFDQYTSLLMWTLGPIVLYVLALGRATMMAVVREYNGAADNDRGDAGDARVVGVRSAIHKAVVGTNQLALGLISLIHTLICVRIFQVFDCIEFDVGSQEGPTISHGGIMRISSSDLSLDCESSKHKSFEAYAYFMVVVYVAIVPAAMALDKRRLRSTKVSHGLLSAPYKQEYWWFDAADLYYRLSMTGFLLLVLPGNANMRIVYCVYLAISFLAYITYAKPFINDSLNKILMTGQFVVCITVAR